MYQLKKSTIYNGCHSISHRMAKMEHCITVDGNVAKTAQDAGIEKQFNKLKINFNPAVELKEKLANVDVELDGIWRCVDIEAENKVYERINQNHDGVELPDGDEDEIVNPDGPSGDNGGNDDGSFAG